MKQRTRRPPRDIPSDVLNQFERWRRSRKRGTRIPEALWQAAAEAAEECGVSKTAQALGLDYYKLKSRVESPVDVPESRMAGSAQFHTTLKGCFPKRKLGQATHSAGILPTRLKLASAVHASAVCQFRHGGSLTR